jgi:hypothetical protein
MGVAEQADGVAPKRRRKKRKRCLHMSISLHCMPAAADCRIRNLDLSSIIQYVQLHNDTLQYIVYYMTIVHARCGR